MIRNPLDTIVSMHSMMSKVCCVCVSALFLSLTDTSTHTHTHTAHTRTHHTRARTRRADTHTRTHTNIFLLLSNNHDCNNHIDTPFLARSGLARHVRNLFHGGDTSSLLSSSLFSSFFFACSTPQSRTGCATHIICSVSTLSLFLSLTHTRAHTRQNINSRTTYSLLWAGPRTTSSGWRGVANTLSLCWWCITRTP